MHYGQKCYPTQLFEVFALLVILITVYRTKSKFKAYLFLYAVSRFIIEYFRGDDRGDLFGALEETRPGDQIDVTVIRGKEEKTLTVTLSDRAFIVK